MKKTLLKILTVLGILMVAVALFSLRQLSEPLVGGMEVAIEVPDDDTLVGTYYPGNGDIGFLLLEGFGSDQTALKPMTAELTRTHTDLAPITYHVFNFDFSGHGRSSGGLDFNNAATDRLAKQVLAAEASFKELSGLSSDQIYWIGHSLGARVALQAATITDQPPAGLCLLGTQINLGSNEQSEFFTGVQDNNLEWIQGLGPKNPNTDIFLLSGKWDDILSPEAAIKLTNKLSGMDLDDKQTSSIFQKEPARILILQPKLLHNYEIYVDASTSLPIFIIEFDMLSQLSENDKEGRWAEIEFTVFDQIYFWFLGIAGLFLALIAGSALTDKPARPAPSAAVTRVGWFIGGKLLLWVPALVPGALIASVVFFAPLGTPAFNLYYIGFFGGYGVLLWFLYRQGKMPGVDGKLTLKGNPQADPQRAYLGGLAFILVLLAVSLMARSGWWYTFPLNHRFIWLLVFTPITALGFMIGFREIEMLRASQPGRHWLVWVNVLVGLFPFFLYTAFLASLGSLSGVVGSLQGLLILALAIVTGALVEKLSARPWMAALMQAFLLYWLILPQGVLFR